MLRLIKAVKIGPAGDCRILTAKKNRPRKKRFRKEGGRDKRGPDKKKRGCLKEY
jgi:hypothetical protein